LQTIGIVFIVETRSMVNEEWQKEGISSWRWWFWSRWSGRLKSLSHCLFLIHASNSSQDDEW